MKYLLDCLTDFVFCNNNQENMLRLPEDVFREPSNSNPIVNLQPSTSGFNPIVTEQPSTSSNQEISMEQCENLNDEELNLMNHIELSRLSNACSVLIAHYSYEVSKSKNPDKKRLDKLNKLFGIIIKLQKLQDAQTIKVQKENEILKKREANIPSQHQENKKNKGPVHKVKKEAKKVKEDLKKRAKKVFKNTLEKM